MAFLAMTMSIFAVVGISNNINNNNNNNNNINVVKQTQTSLSQNQNIVNQVVLFAWKKI